MSTWAGNLIKLARREAGLSQRELASRAETSQATLSAYESGSKQPSLETLARIVRAAGQDLRIQLAAYDDHDEIIAAYQAALPESTRRAKRRRNLSAINSARRARGLKPVTEADLVGISDRG